MKTTKIIYYTTKAIFTALMLFSVTMYLTQTEMIKGAFTSFGYPDYLVYPLATAKILGLIVLWQTKFKTIKEWVYAGFVYNVLLAFFAHTMISDGEHLFALVGIILIAVNYFTYKKINK
jgi:hypothetical protein